MQRYEHAGSGPDTYLSLPLLVRPTIPAVFSKCGWNVYCWLVVFSSPNLYVFLHRDVMSICSQLSTVVIWQRKRGERTALAKTQQCNTWWQLGIYYQIFRGSRLESGKEAESKWEWTGHKEPCIPPRKVMDFCGILSSEIILGFGMQHHTNLVWGDRWSTRESWIKERSRILVWQFLWHNRPRRKCSGAQHFCCIQCFQPLYNGTKRALWIQVVTGQNLSAIAWITGIFYQIASVKFTTGLSLKSQIMGHCFCTNSGTCVMMGSEYKSLGFPGPCTHAHLFYSLNPERRHFKHLCSVVQHWAQGSKSVS